MHFSLSGHIEIGSYRLRGFHSVVIKKSVYTLVQTAVVMLPLSVVFRNKDLNVLETIPLASRIKEGDRISISIGYNGVNRTEFTGYIKRINYKQPLELECEDALYLLRKQYFTESYRNISAKALITQVLDRLNVVSGLNIALYGNVPDVTVGNFYPRGKSGIWILEEIKKFGITCFLYNNAGRTTLYAGLNNLLRTGNVLYRFGYNTISEDDLKYQRTEDKKYKVTVVNWQRNGTNSRETFGEEGGDAISINAYNASKKDMEQLAKAEVERLSQQGYKGKLETFLLPYAEPGMVAEVKDDQFPERAGRYYIGEVETTVDNNGGRRRPALSIKL